MKSESTSIQRALIVYVELRDSRVDGEYSEFCQLVNSTGLEVIGTVTANRLRAEPKFFRY